MPPGLMIMLFANPFVYSWIVEWVTDKVKDLSMGLKKVGSMFNNFKRRGKLSKE